METLLFSEAPAKGVGGEFDGKGVSQTPKLRPSNGVEALAPSPALKVSFKPSLRSHIERWEGLGLT